MNRVSFSLVLMSFNSGWKWGKVSESGVAQFVDLTLLFFKKREKKDILAGEDILNKGNSYLIFLSVRLVYEIYDH